MTTGHKPGGTPVVTVRSYGDAAVMVEATSAAPAARRAVVRQLRERLLAQRPHGVLDVVAGLESLLVGYDPLVTGPEHVGWAARLLAETGPDTVVADRTPREFVVPVVFDATTGPDLADVAAELGLTTNALIEAVTGSRFTVALLAAAMAPMLDGLDTPHPVRRRAEPRTDVPPGSLMVAGTGALVQPFPGPSGWRVVGATPHTVVDITRADPAAFAPGDTVRIVAVDSDRAAGLTGRFLLPQGTPR